MAGESNVAGGGAADAGAAGAAGDGGAQADAGGVIGSAPEAKVAGEGGKEVAQTPEQKAAAEATAKADAAKSEITLKLPDGFKADEKQLGEFKALAKELKLDSAGAQKLFDWNANAQKAAAKAQDLALDQQEKAWAKELAEDKDFGGKNFEGSKIAIGRVLTKFDTADKAARKVIGESGLGSNPVIAKFLARIGNAISEDKVGGGNAPQNGSEKKTIDSPAFLKGLFNNTKRA